MSAAARLLERQAELRKEIQRGRVPKELRADVIEHLQLSLEATAGRAQAVGQQNADRWARNHALVREALGASPLEHRLDGLVDLVSRRLQGALGPRTIRKHLLALRHEVCTAEPKCHRGCVTVSGDP